MDVFVEKQIPGNACHREICRFKGYSDPMYRIISSEMIDLCKKACYVPCTWKAIGYKYEYC